MGVRFSIVFLGEELEVFNSANSQYPSIMVEIMQKLVSLISEGKLREIDGEQLYALLNIGLKLD
jgi:hypothetical protein